MWLSCTTSVCICWKYSELQWHLFTYCIFHSYLSNPLFSSSTPVSSLKWLHNGVVVASQNECSRTTLIHQLWSVDSDDEGVYTCRMELSNGTTVERNLSQPLNVVGMHISSGYHVILFFLCMYFRMDPATLEPIENCMAILQACIKICMQHILKYGAWI